MSYSFKTTSKFESKICEGVVVYIRRMTEGRRIELRKLIGDQNKRIREIIREQSEIDRQYEAIRDTNKWMDLNEEFDQIMIEHINPAWIEWGVAKIEGLEAEGRPLEVKDWAQWPSNLTKEIVQAIKDESELDGGERQNLSSRSTSGEGVGQSPSSTTALPAGARDTTEVETAEFSTQPA